MSSRIPVQIIPKMRNNRRQLHVYPLNDIYHSQMHSNCGGEHSSEEKADPEYVKKLEYSADKIQISASKHKRSHRKKQKRADRSQEVHAKSADNVEVDKKSRKNTLSGQKRTYAHLSSDRGTPEKRKL